jgi:hypothetical protein
VRTAASLHGLKVLATREAQLQHITLHHATSSLARGDTAIAPHAMSQSLTFQQQCP